MASADSAPRKSRRVTLGKPFTCPWCKGIATTVLRVDTATEVELYCLNDGCGVLVVSKPATR